MATNAKRCRGSFRVVWVAVFPLLCLWLTNARLVAQANEDPSSPTVRISVFSLFKPRVLRISAISNNEPLLLDVDGESEQLVFGSTALIELVPKSGIRASTSSWHKAGRSLRVERESGDLARPTPGSPAAFWLEVPGKLRRRFVGTLAIHAEGDSLEAIVTMPLETAVASVVQAESPPGAPLEALKAQAVAARSFLVARQAGHVRFDFCDTTHCQFLRSPPPEESLAAKATRATLGIVVTWHDPASAEERTLAAMYARSCGGRTRSLREIGLGGSGYPYYAVRCAYCSRHPELWRRDHTTPNAKGDTPHTETQRLAYNRIHGWSAMPSLSQSGPDQAGLAQSGMAQSGMAQSMSEDERSAIAGRGVGHGLGLCQLGAADMARRGASFDRILAHYYPNTRLTDLARSGQLPTH
jgi:stage II sporulation protein D